MQGATMGPHTDRYLIFQCARCASRYVTTSAVWTSEKRARFLRTLGWQLPDEHDPNHLHAWVCPVCGESERRA